MQALQQQYVDYLEQFAEAIQNSDQLAAYLDTEEESEYKVLQETFEPPLQQLYDSVAENQPLQILALEEALLDPRLEGLMISKILGYNILRGNIDETFRFKRPQDRLGKILQAISTSSNFEILKSKIGQAIQVCFAVSSDIWTTSFLESITLKSVKSFFLQQRMNKYIHLKERMLVYNNYKRQFESHNFWTTSFPETKTELFQYYEKLINFFTYRIKNNLSHSSYEDELLKLLQKKEFAKFDEYVHITLLSLNFVDFSEENHKEAYKVLNELRKDDETFTKRYFEQLEHGFRSNLYFNFETDKRVFNLLDKTITDDLTKYYETTVVIANKGFVHEDAIESVRTKYNAHEGLSFFNECLRYSILGHFNNVIENFDVDNYQDYFELNNVIVPYVNIFENQQFNQGLKASLVRYIKKLLKRYTDKRGKDYQDIKKFVQSTFLDLNFMTEKELKEFFKTKRKRPTPSKV